MGRIPPDAEAPWRGLNNCGEERHFVQILFWRGRSWMELTGYDVAVGCTVTRVETTLAGELMMTLDQHVIQSMIVKSRRSLPSGTAALENMTTIRRRSLLKGLRKLWRTASLVLHPNPVLVTVKPEPSWSPVGGSKKEE